MGLDMYLEKVNVDLDQEEIKNYKKYLNINAQYEEMKKLVELIKENKIEDLVTKRFKHKLKQYEDYQNGENIIWGENRDDYVYDMIDPDMPVFSDFDTKEDLINYYIEETKKYFEKGRKMIEEIENDEEKQKLLNKFKEVKNEEVYSWRNFDDLNDYLKKLYHQKTNSKKDFNSKLLVLNKSDIEKLLKDWDFEDDRGQAKESKEKFKELLNKFDFENNTLIYSNWH